MHRNYRFTRHCPPGRCAGNMAKQMVCLDDFETHASKYLSRSIYGYYRSGSDEEQTKADNREAFKRYRLLPRVLRDVSSIDMSTTILGHKMGFPVGIAPTALHKMAHPDGEVATAKAAGAMDVVYTLSTYGTSTMADVVDNSRDTLKFFQSYVVVEDSEQRPITANLLKLAEKNGFKAIVVTIDSSVLGKRRENLRNNFVMPAHLKVEMLQDVHPGVDLNDIRHLDRDKALTWDFIGWLKSVTSLPIVIKGLMAPADAVLAADHGVAAVWISNHGGRQLDTVPATIDVLEPIVRAVAGRCEVYLDGGIRCGTDVFKALALGANAVFIGRPIIYGLAYDGMAGVQQVLEILKDEFYTAMALSGCSKIADINRDFVVHETEYLSKL